MEVQEYLELQGEFAVKLGVKITLNQNSHLICNICNANILRGQIITMKYPKNYVCVKHCLRDYNKEIKYYESVIQEIKTQQENAKKLMQKIEEYNTIVRL